ncbi:hypothetical protein HYE67_010118 [Fusarium culmorum]|nr:hypothetical protein HYE67_010118 [Fusarium culmorum]
MSRPTKYEGSHNRFVRLFIKTTFPKDATGRPSVKYLKHGVGCYLAVEALIMSVWKGT